MKKEDWQERAEERKKCIKLPFDMSLDKAVSDKISCFCAGVVWRINEGRIEFAYINYHRNGMGISQKKIAGGMGMNKTKEKESPIATLKRELKEELGVSVADEECFLIYAKEHTLEEKHPHVKFFFLVTEPKQKLRHDAFDEETGVPQWGEWFDVYENLFGVHKEVFSIAKQELCDYFRCEEQLEYILATLASGLMEPDNKIKGLLRQRAKKDGEFAFNHSEILETIGV